MTTWQCRHGILMGETRCPQEWPYDDTNAVTEATAMRAANARGWHISCARYANNEIMAWCPEHGIGECCSTAEVTAQRGHGGTLARAIEQTLLSHGPFATGTGGFGTPVDPEVVADVAADWAAAGFTAAQVDEWLGARVFTPAAARALLNREIFPDQASRMSGPDQGLGQYADTVGYKLANNDLSPAEADEIIRSW